MTETDTEVRVRVPLRVDGRDCTAIGLPLTVTVLLRQPLGDRAVVDAGTGGRLRVDDG